MPNACALDGLIESLAAGSRAKVTGDWLALSDGTGLRVLRLMASRLDG